MAFVQNGYGPMIGQTPEGYPIYSYTDPRSNVVSFVVVLPDGRAFYSDAYGNIAAPGGQLEAEVAGAIVTGTLGGLAGGPVGAMVGAVAGAIMGKFLKKQAA
jgi:hypothetical protein